MSDARRQILESVNNLLDRNDFTADDFVDASYTLLITALAKSPRWESSLANIERGALRADLEGWVASLAARRAAKGTLH
jgi:hypothetical protein